MTMVEGAKKRKHGSKELRPIHYFEGSENEDGEASNSGDGSSSGESISSDTPARSKRQCTSGIVTRSSTKTPAPSTSIGPHDPQPSDVSADNVNVDGSPNGNAPRASYLAGSIGVGGTTFIETEMNFDPDTEHHETTNVEDPTISVIGTEGFGRTSATDPAPKSSPPSFPASSNDIDPASIPAFLLSHGKGRREVNIFAYLNEVTDPHFRRALFHYIRFEINDKSGVGGSLPTDHRPTEIGQWSSRARPNMIPTYPKDGRSFLDFIDSVFVWWGSIQPSWRTFKRGEVSREVRGGWDALYAPRINGLLNVIMLAYWWINILENGEPEEGMRADYEFFADDVAWVLSNLST